MRRVFDRFEYEPANIIGVGGMGTVYKGLDTANNNAPVAIKYLKPDIVQNNADMVTRFQREGEALRELNHPNIVKVLGAGQCENEHYLIMEYVAGGSLQDLLDRKARIIVQRALYIALDLADALTRAHRLNILHRDIKPANVLLADDGTPRLTDFGVARVHASEMTQEGQLIGTLAYLSPESITGGHLDERHDIWAFGVLLFELLTGRRPFESDMIGTLITQITTQPIPDIEALRPDAPVALVDLIYRMLARNPEHRIRSARQVGAELEAIIHSADTGGIIGVATSQGRFQTTGAGQITPTPTPSSTISTRPKTPKLHNFPVPATPFVGRTQEVSEIIKLINDPEQRLITLVGVGGMGKTRIAQAVAESVVQQFPDGVYFVPLAPVNDPKLVPTKIAEAMNFQFSGAGDPKVEMMNFLRDKEALLILDNMEHLVAGAEMLADGMSQIPNMQLLVTSRERLRLRGETIYEVNSMLLPPPNISVVEMEGYPATQLFMSSASRSAPDFELTDDNAQDVCKVLQGVQGVPLGIELAAGWLEMLDIDEIAREIDDSLDFLETDMRDMPERHRSIRAVFDYSWNLMNTDERNAFMKLSVFRGGFERGAAKKVLGTSLRTLTALMNKSLLSRQPDGRYMVAKLLRQYAQEHFDEECAEREAVYTAYVEYYADFLKKLAPLFNTKDDLKALSALETDIENVRHAWQLAVERELFDLLQQMFIPMNDYFFARSMLNEAIELFGGLAEKLRTENKTDLPLYWSAYVAHMGVLGRQGNYREAEKGARVAVEHLREHHYDDTLFARALNILAYPLMMLGGYAESRRLLYEAGGLLKPDQLDTTLLLAQTTGNLGYMEFLAGNLEEAKRIYEDLTANYYSLERSPVGFAFGMNNLGEILQVMGNLDEANEKFQIAYDTFKSYDHRRGMAFTTNNLAGVATIQGNIEEAQKLYRKAYRINRDIGDLAGIGHSLSAMANMALFEQKYTDALGYYQQVADLRRTTGDQINYARTLTEIATVYYLMGRVDESRKYSDEALDIAEELDSDFLRALAYFGVGGYMLYDGNRVEGMNYLKQALRMAATDTDNPSFVFALISIAVILSERGFDEQAAQVIGYIDQYHQGHFENFGERILGNIRYALRNQMGAAYTVASAKGQRLTIDDIIKDILN